MTQRSFVDCYLLTLFCTLLLSPPLLSTDSAGTNHHQHLIREEARLSALRDKMISELTAKGINGRYLSEMRNLDIGKILRR